jgi:copper chaperone
MKKLLTIEGMTCGHCVMHVKSALSELGGVKSVDVDLQKKSAAVEGDALDDQAMKTAVAEAGYEVTAVSGAL